MNYNLLFYIVIAILSIQFILDMVLDYLNARNFKDTIPTALQDVFDKEEYRKSQAYKKANYRFGVFGDTFSFFTTIIFLLLGGFEWVDNFTRSITEHQILMPILFFAIVLFGSSIISLPFSFYHTFVIEQKFGFNKTTVRTFLSDLVKGWVLGAIFGSAILALVIWALEWSGPQFWLWTWVLFTAVTLFLNLYYSRLIVPLFNKQVPLESGSLKQAIEAYAQKVGFELKNIFVIDGSKRSTKANAYFSGIGKEKRISLYDTLIEDLEEDEIVAVLAHEVGHYQRNHIIINLVISIIVTGFTLFVFSLFVNNPEMSKAIGVSQPSFHAAILGFGLLYSPFSEITGLIMKYFSRKFEFQADDYAKDTYKPEALVNSLKKLSKNNLSNLTPHPAYVFMHYTHPPLAERIKNLEA